MQAIFLADAHLRSPDEDAYQDFLAFLEELPGNPEYLFILGDFFDFWYAGPRTPKVYQPVLQALQKAVVQGLKIHLLAGNHEISGGPSLTDAGLQWHAEGCRLTLGNRKLYLAHGDLFNVDDYGYRFWHRLIRHPLSQRLAAGLPPALVMKIAGTLSRRSRKRPAKQKQIPVQVYRRAAELLKKNDLEVVIIGHFHQVRRESFTLNDQLKNLLMLGGWENDRSYLKLDNGDFSFDNFRRSEPGNV